GSARPATRICTRSWPQGRTRPPGCVHPARNPQKKADTSAARTTTPEVPDDRDRYRDQAETTRDGRERAAGGHRRPRRGPGAWNAVRRPDPVGRGRGSLHLHPRQGRGPDPPGRAALPGRGPAPPGPGRGTRAGPERDRATGDLLVHPAPTERGLPGLHRLREVVSGLRVGEAGLPASDPRALHPDARPRGSLGTGEGQTARPDEVPAEVLDVHSASDR